MRMFVLRVVAATVAVAAMTAAFRTPHFAFVFLGLAALLVLATSFSNAARARRSLHQFLSDEVEIHVWGAPLQPAKKRAHILASVKVLGAGLHLYVRIDGSAGLEHLKIAQPRGIVIAAGGVTIESASYVQWVGTRLPKTAGTPAVTVQRTNGRNDARGGAG